MVLPQTSGPTFIASMSSPPPPKKESSAALRPLYFVAGIILVGIGIAGYILPVLPGTIWMILAAACFARSSPKFEAWLINHKTFGPSVVAWRQNGAIPRKAKFLAIGMMAISFTVLAFTHIPMVALVIIGAIFLACALFVASRPVGPRTRES
jgi:uncharacterized membrane protein YbaN (DUF454 family)